MDKEKWINLTELSEAVDVSESTLRKYKARGMPARKVKNKLQFLASSVRIWMRDNHLTGDLGHPPGRNSEELKQQQTRKTKAQADLAELQLAKERGELILKSDVEQGRILRISFVKNGLRGLASSLAPQLVGLSAVEIQTLIDDEVNRLLDHFSKQ